MIPFLVVSLSFLSMHPSQDIRSFKRPLNSAVPFPFFSEPVIRNFTKIINLYKNVASGARVTWSNPGLEFSQFTVIRYASLLGSCYCTIYTMSLNKKIRFDTTKCYKWTLFVATLTWNILKSHWPQMLSNQKASLLQKLKRSFYMISILDDSKYCYMDRN